ncbi:MAG: hypothetical protein NT109_02955 [Flavobacteriia bacterium]|nr:hypothetical protein [Flavobacteriia bacterium]
MKAQEIINKRILISPLNWGYGHLSRCISIIDILLKNNNVVFFAGKESDFSILREYFSNEINYIQHTPYPFVFHGQGFRISDFIRSLIPLIKCYKQELKTVSLLVEEHKINLVISDHRYGFRTAKCRSIFITHQCYLPIHRIAWPIQVFHQFLIKKFSEVWIMDDKQKRLAGKLSASLGPMCHYIGIHSRFADSINSERKKDIEGILLVSGPIEFSPALVNHFRDTFIEISEPKYIVGSSELLSILPLELSNYFKPNNIWRETDDLLLRTKTILSYSGYSTLMDLELLKCKAILIATKGQSEQIYLAKKQKASVND